jgi:hypothetical protein
MTDEEIRCKDSSSSTYYKKKKIIKKKKRGKHRNAYVSVFERKKNLVSNGFYMSFA